jgi:SAM-dependent methyltransferase
MAFCIAHLAKAEVEGRDVLEVGAFDVNGSLRNWIESLKPRKYVGTDIMPGPGVDEVCAAENLLTRFSGSSFDVVVATEVVEHVEDWRSVFRNLKGVLRPGGCVLVTTRSKGFQMHGYPCDFWRYEVTDMREIFADFEIRALESDSSAPGVFVKACKPLEFQAKSLEDIWLYSVVRHRRAQRVTRVDRIGSRILLTCRNLGRAVVPASMKPFLKCRIFDEVPP